MEFGGQEAQELGRLLGHFLQAYGAKPEGQPDEAWLESCLMGVLPELGAEQAAAQSRETIAAIRAYDRSLASLLSAIENGQTESSGLPPRRRSQGFLRKRGSCVWRSCMNPSSRPREG